jgi:hypothetical protein
MQDHVRDLQTSLVCPRCRHRVTLRPERSSVSDAVLATTEFVCGDLGQWRSHAWIGLCPCGQFILVIGNGAHATTYPAASYEPTSTVIPDAIRAIADEAKLCLSQEAPNGAAMLARRALQMSLRHLGARNGNLVAQIDDLAQRGEIGRPIMQMATATRLVGNEAAHDDQSVSREDAAALIRFMERILEHVIDLEETRRVLAERGR